MEHMFEESMMTTHAPPKVMKSTCTKIVVLGGTGFIGNHLCRKLIEDGHHVIFIDHTFPEPKEELFKNPRFEYIHHNIVNPIELKDTNVSQIYYSVSAAQQEDPMSTIKTCVIGTFNAVELAHKKGARLLLLASTSEGLAETIVVESSKASGLQVRIARIFNVDDEPAHELIAFMNNDSLQGPINIGNP